MKSFTVNSKDLFDKKKNPNLSFSASDILANDKIPKKLISGGNNMTQISMRNYGDYASDNYGANCMQLSVGSLDLYFSYQTVVAFRTPKTGLVISENCWGPTTGKHLNWINEDKKIRLDRTEFEKQMAKVLKTHKLNV